MVSLPIDNLLGGIVGSLRKQPNLVIEAPPGAGKTTRVPPALMEAFPGKILVLEPRRLAARLAARRVASERGEPAGRTVGYQVRFDEVCGPDTRLLFLTEGVLTRRLLTDPRLDGASVVVLDEFHERHLESDLALALLLRLQRTERPDLRLVVMSATLDASAVAAHLGGCPVVRCQGQRYELRITYTPHSAAPLEDQVTAALESLLREGLAGDILVFLPGAAEIRRAARACQPLAARAGLLLLPLHGDLPPEEQDRAVAPARSRKLILSTNVAESSVTIEGVTAVIDSGLARVPVDSPWTGFPSLTVKRISRAAAIQRAGRAGRTAPGRLIRLYSEEDFARRPEKEVPEILRRELSQVVLYLLAMGLNDPSSLPWLDSPPEPSVSSARALLERLGAVGPDGALTPDGRRMVQYPLHPRLGRLILEAESRGAGWDGCRIAAALSAGERLTGPAAHGGRSDVLALLDQEWAPQTVQALEQLMREIRPRRSHPPNDEPLLISILAAFPDRVAHRRQDRKLMMAAGDMAVLADSSGVRDEFLVAVDIEERNRRNAPLVRLASGIDPAWLVDLFPDRVHERHQVEWNKSRERVEVRSALVYDGLVIEESRVGARATEEAERLLTAKALEVGWASFCNAAAVTELQARLEFSAQFAELPTFTEHAITEAFRSMCVGISSFAELRERMAGTGFLEKLLGRLTPAQRRALDKLAPERLRLPGGRCAKVHYAAGQTPWIASYLQDFLGMRETPCIGGGRVPLVVHLLAPNRRPVQTTTDLEGFWQRLYPELRRQLMRRYPKHAWPENPGLRP